MIVLNMSSVSPQSEVDFSVLLCNGRNSWLSFRCQSSLVQYTTLGTMAFIRLIPGCPECSCLRKVFLSFVGTTTQFANIRHSSTDKESLCRLNYWRSPLRSGGYECQRNLRTFCIIGSHWVSHLTSTFVTGIFGHNQWMRAENRPLRWWQWWRCRYLGLIANWCLTKFRSLAVLYVQIVSQ